MYKSAPFIVPVHGTLSPADALRNLAAQAAQLSYVPYSHQPSGAVALFSDGSWVPGARVENASYSLVVPAVSAAIAAAAASGKADLLVAVALSASAHPGDCVYLENAPTGALHEVSPDLFGAGHPLPYPTPQAIPFDTASPDFPPETGIALARAAAAQSLAPFSDFPVGCVIRSRSGALVTGVNVEHADWTRTMCAERSALAGAVALGIRDFTDIYVSCLRDSSGTSCGACLQVVLELAPSATLWFDRTPAPPERELASCFSHATFSGDSLRKDPRVQAS